MPRGVYGADINHTGNSILTAHDMIMTVEGGPNRSTGALVQNVVIQYNQPIQTIREVGSKQFYYYAQPPRGSLSFGRLIAQDKNIFDVLPKRVAGENGGAVLNQNVWTTPADGQTNPTIILQSIDGESAARIKYKCFQCIVNNYAVNTDAQQAFVSEQISITFGTLQISDEG